MIKSQCTGFLNTPPLWENKQFDIQQFEFPITEVNSFHPTAIPGNLRFGHQMEYVFKQLIEHSETYDIVLHNLQVWQGKRTLGEIDFILKDTNRDKLIHVELSYKFYIIDPEVSDPIQSLIGPNKRDKFSIKMEKMKSKQFPLLHSVEGAKALKDKGIDHSEIEHQSCFKAQLFQAYGSVDVKLGTLNQNCLAGYWLRFDEFKKSEFVKAQFYMPSKSEWVTQVQDQVEWKSHVEIMIDLVKRLKKESAPMLWMKKESGVVEKIFVVWW